MFRCRLVLVAVLLAFVFPAFGQNAAPAPEKVDQLIQLLADPAVKDWLAKQVQPPAPARTQPVEAQPAAPTQPEGGMERTMVSSGLDRFKAHVERIALAFPDLPNQFARTKNIAMQEFSDRGLFGVFLLFAAFIAAGLGLMRLVYRLTRRFRLWLISLPRDTPQGRAKKVGSRILYSMMLVVAFAVGSAGAFMLFEWPPLLREIVLTYLSAAIVVWAVRLLVISTLVPSFMDVAHAEEVRALPISTQTADHWSRWLFIIAIWVMFVAATFALLPILGFTHDGILALSVPADIVVFALVLTAVWLRPRPSPGDEASRRIGYTAATWLFTVYFITLLLLRLAGAATVFWFAVAAFLLPALVVLAHRAVYFILRPGPEEAGRPMIPAVTIAVIERGIRVVLILLAAVLLARVWGLDMATMESTQHPTMTLILRALLNASIIAIAADFGWSIVKALIERKLGVDMPPPGTGEEAHALDPQQARLRTLLPIIQNIMFAVILIMAILMMLSSIGIQIGPLIAGAGVVGVAVGFGAQTVVKDVISGVFYLLDDAFRVGEYITSGKYMGTVESFSLRSIKLRHHRGPLFTIPFGELGAVQNQSRDWATDKFNLTVGFDTDLEFARKLIKRIGLTLAEDPEFKPWIIEPIKMQGVQEFGDYGIVIRMKVTMKPGGAFQMKRKFYVAIRQAFKENGIKLPGPTVQVQQDETAIAALAAAQAHTTRRKKQAAVKAAEEAG